MPFSETHTPESTCPYCDNTLDAAGNLRTMSRPTEGDISVCIYCAQILFFNADLTLRKPRDGELERIYRENPEMEYIMRRTAQEVRKMDRRNMGRGRRS